jgi:TetR/AcrR family acrAB operon transcriptional repressor
MGQVMARHQNDMREGMANIAGGLRNAVSKGQLPADLDTARAASILHSFVSGALRDMLFLPCSVDFGKHAHAMVEAVIDMLRYSPALRVERGDEPAPQP